MNTKPITFGSLFAGIGGLDLGFERVGMECKWQVEIDDYATRVLERHWPDVRRWRDIRTFPPDTNSDSESTSTVEEEERQGHQIASGWKVDVMCGGFPCQDISYAGKGAGLDGERSGLFYEAIRVIRELEPKVIVLENVAALLTRGLPGVLGTLASLGFDAEWHCIPAAAVGAPHIRDRVFVIANACSERCRQLEQHVQRGKESERSICSYRKRRIERPRYSGWWAVEPDVGRVADGVPRRVDRLRGLGNAAVPQVAEVIGEIVIDRLLSNEGQGDGR